MRLLGVIWMMGMCLLTLNVSGQDSLKVDRQFNFLPKLDYTFKTQTFNAKPQSQLYSPFEVKNLPIFCKIEHQLSKSSNVNVRMRLGSLDYVNKLEGK